jgi:hypothetical protein
MRVSHPASIADRSCKLGKVAKQLRWMGLTSEARLSGNRCERPASRRNGHCVECVVQAPTRLNRATSRTSGTRHAMRSGKKRAPRGALKMRRLVVNPPTPDGRHISVSGNGPSVGNRCIRHHRRPVGDRGIVIRHHGTPRRPVSLPHCTRYTNSSTSRTRRLPWPALASRERRAPCSLQVVPTTSAS